MTLKKSGRVFALAAGLFAVTGELSAAVRVVGSDLLGLEFSRAFYAHAGRAGVAVALAFDGSREGLAHLKSGRADLGLIVVPQEAELGAAGLRTAVVAFHPVVVLVPAACPLEAITVPQLAAIFGAGRSSAAATTLRWRDLGVKGDWSQAALLPLVPESSSGLTVAFFRSTVLHEGAWKRGVVRYADVADLAVHFGGEAKPIALAATFPATTVAIRALPVARGASQKAVVASPETLAAGTYPLRAAVHVVFREEKLADIPGLLEFLYSDDAARALARADIVALPTAARNERLRALGVKEKPAP